MEQRSLWQQIASFDRVFWICIFMELMERMAYYGVRLVVPVFLVLAPSDGGPGLDHAQKGTILAAWAAMQSWLPTIAGGFSDRFGYKRTIGVAILLKTLGYAAMAMASGYWTMLLGTQLLAAGTGLFKPGIQGTMAHSIAKHPGQASMGWGLFYQSVNVGAALSAYIPMFTRDVYGWHSVFAACSAIVFSNFLTLQLYTDPVDERQTTKDSRGVVDLVWESVYELLSSPVLLGFIFISAGFWFTFHQLFDMLPNYVDDWTDSSVLYASVGGVFGVQSWVDLGVQGVNVPQERLLNINALMIMFTMFLFAWASSRLHPLVSTIVGMGLASLSLIALMFSASVWWVLFGVVLFTIGEMLSSPKRQEYMASLAPPGKRALYLGYANMPDGIGWVLGSLIAGATYEEKGDKVNLARRFFAEHGSSTAADGWIARATEAVQQAAGLSGEAQAKALEAAGLSTKALDELAKRGAEALKVDEDPLVVLKALESLPDDKVVAGLAEVMPRGEAMESFVQLVPTLPNGVASTEAALRDYLFVTYQPGGVWALFIGMGMFSMVLMIGYDRWVRARLPKA